MSDPKRARCYDKDWRYTPQSESDIRKTFARIRRQQKEEEAARPANVKPIRSAKGGKA